MFLTHRFQALAEHVQPLQIPPRGKEREDPGFLFSPLSARRNVAPAKSLGSTMSTDVIQLSTGLLLGITMALFNSVIRITIECCFIRVISQTLRSLTASEMSP